jgi:hypothetical protein
VVDRGEVQTCRDFCFVSKRRGWLSLEVAKGSGGARRGRGWGWAGWLCFGLAMVSGWSEGVRKGGGWVLEVIVQRGGEEGGVGLLPRPGGGIWGKQQGEGKSGEGEVVVLGEGKGDGGCWVC